MTALPWTERIAAARETLAGSEGQAEEALVAEQTALARRVRLDPLGAGAPATVTGVDVQYGDDGARSALVTLALPSLTVTHTERATGRPGEGYAFGFLAYRELPVILDVLARLEGPPEVLFYDGNGTLHPRGCGAASHLGVLLDIPVIGVSKNVAAWRPFAETRRGETRMLEGGRGALLVTRDDVNPVCVSPGHRVDLASALALTLAVSHVRLPEPIRLADRLARHGDLG